MIESVKQDEYSVVALRAKNGMLLPTYASEETQPASSPHELLKRLAPQCLFGCETFGAESYTAMEVWRAIHLRGVEVAAIMRRALDLALGINDAVAFATLKTLTMGAPEILLARDDDVFIARNIICAVGATSESREQMIFDPLPRVRAYLPEYLIARASHIPQDRDFTMRGLRAPIVCEVARYEALCGTMDALLHSGEFAAQNIAPDVWACAICSSCAHHTTDMLLLLLTHVSAVKICAASIAWETIQHYAKATALNIDLQAVMCTFIHVARECASRELWSARLFRKQLARWL